MWVNVLLGILGLFAFLYWHLTKKYGYFKSRGMFEAPATFPFGSEASWQMFTGKGSFSKLGDCYYQKYPNERAVGNISMGKPQLCINDMELAKNIMIKDFDHFMDRRKIEMGDTSEVQKLLNRMLTTLDGEKWKQIRSKISPVFTSGKLKQMTPLIHRVGQDFHDYLGKMADNNEEFLGKDVYTLYTLDAIATCGFGVEVNSFRDPDNIFCKMTKRFTAPNKLAVIKIFFIIAFPAMAKMLNITFVDEEATAFFVDVIKKTMKSRKENKERRNDMIDLVLDALKDTSQVKETEDDQFEKDAKVEAEGTLVLSDIELERCLISNALVLFLAGFDTSSTAMAVMSCYLANNQDIQERLYQEIAEAVENNKGSLDLDYNTIQELPYLDQTIHETLRIHPLTVIERNCTKPYQIPGTSFVIPKDMLVQIPANAIHRDPRNFPNPDEFDPDNFSPENKAGRSPYTFLSFGQGPRNCVGMRFALLQVKIAMIRVMHGYKIVRGEKTPTKIEHDPMSQSAQPIGGSWVKVERRN